MSSATSSPAVSTSRPHFLRRTYLIDQGFQLKYVLVLAVVGVGVSVLFGTMMYLAHLDAARSLPLPPMVLETWDRGQGTMVALTLGMAVLMGGALSLFGVLITHRVAGPIYVITRYVETLAKGRYPIMRPLRKTDELRPFFEQFQEAVESMRRREMDEVKALEAALAALGSVDSPGLAPAVDALGALRDKKRDATERLNLKSPNAPAAGA
jgi:hypothetical protein